MANEIFNVNGVKKAMEDLQTKFSDFADILAEANGYVETVINVTDDSAVYGNYGTKLQSIWDQNYVTFDNFHKNFESWAEVVSLISANNIDFTVSAEAVYRDNAGTLDGIQGARTVIKESGGRNNVDVDSVHDSDVNKVLSYMSDYVLDESAGNNGSEGTGTDNPGEEENPNTTPEKENIPNNTEGQTPNEDGQEVTNTDNPTGEQDSSDTTEPSIDSIYTLDGLSIKSSAKEVYEQFYNELEDLETRKVDLLGSRRALEANRSAYSSEEYDEKIKEYDAAIATIKEAMEQRESGRDALKKLLDGDASFDTVNATLSNINSFENVLKGTTGFYESENAFLDTSLVNLGDSPYAQSMTGIMNDSTSMHASQLSFQNAYDLSSRRGVSVASTQDSNVQYFSTADYLKSGFDVEADLPSREYDNLYSAEVIEIDGKNYDSVAYKNPATGKIEFYSVEEWKKRSEAQ